MKIVILDGATVVQNDLSWDGFNEFGEMTYYERTNPEDVINRIGDADVVISSKCLINKEVMDANPNLKYIGVIATGYNNVDISYAKEKGIAVTNIPAYSTNSVAQFAFSLLLEATNRVGLHSNSVHRGDWEKSTDFCYLLTPQVELADKTFGIVGYGNIGKKVASLANAFGMKVLVYSSHMNVGDSDEIVDAFVNLEDLLTNSDVVSLHCALNDSNQEMINSRTLKMMKRNAILINTSRGPLINEDDLANALKDGEIAMAALDVLPSEPPREGSPLIGIDNCIITPHIAWITKEARQRLIDIATNNLGAFVSKKPINRIV